MSGQADYDVVIVGAGPAGLAAGLYTSRDRIKTLMLDKMIPGGQINTTDRIENYPGYLKISGPDLVAVMQKQCEEFGADIRQASEATKLSRSDDGIITIEINKKDTVTTRSVILTPGSEYRKLGVPGEDEFRKAGAGVSYCGTCDAPFFRDKVVVSVGGGNSAVEETLHLAKFAKKVYMVHRRQEFRATPVLVEELQSAIDREGKIELVLDTIVTAIEGDKHVERAVVKNVKSEQTGTLECDGVFIFIGMVPNTHFLEGFVNLDDRGMIHCEPWNLKTSVPGVFVAGDCRVGAAAQLATACGDAVRTAMMLKNYLKDPAWWDKEGPDGH